ncbi:MAG: DUF2760 domain-containing protein [Desulfobacteraceae bacterium]|jgi:hypothetical protein
MDTIKSYSRRSLLLIIVIMVLFAGAFAAAVYFGKPHVVHHVVVQMTQLTTAQISPAETTARMTSFLDTYVPYIVTIFASVSILFGIILWLVLRGVAKGALSGNVPEKSATAKKAASHPPKKDDTQPIRNQRLFLHLLTVLQREGRLVDFFQEDLEMYEDEQIGAAVRNIHGNCQKILSKSLSMKPVIAGDEGDAFTVEAGFDPDAIKLTGRVIGEPPFEGTIRHKGWRARELELPDLTAIKDPTIIYPAEVEID